MEQKLRRYSSTLQCIFDAARDRAASTVVLAGDVFEHSNVYPKERDVLLRCLLSNWDIRVLIINGNHDVLERGYTSLHFLSILQASNRIPHVTVAEIKPVRVIVDGIHFLLVPFVGKERLFYKRVSLLVKQVSDEFPKKPPPIVVASHEMFRGSITDLDTTGEYTKSGIRFPRIPEVTYWALGDIHRCQQIAKGAHYSGPPVQMNFGETLEKGVLLVDTDDPHHPEFIPIQHSDILPLINLEDPTEDDIQRIARDPGWVNLRSNRNNVDVSSCGVVVKVTPKASSSTRHTPQDLIRQAHKQNLSRDLRAWLLHKKNYTPEDAGSAIRLVKPYLLRNTE